MTNILSIKWVKCVCIWSISAPYFLAFGLNTEIDSANLRIQSKYWKSTDQETSEYEYFHAMI